MLHLAQKKAADALLDRDPFALLAGMMLDQQVPMEKAFAGPAVVLERLTGSSEGMLDPRAVAGADPDDFAALLSRPPAVHRFPGSMAGRLQALATAVIADYDGDAARIWTQARDGADVLRRLQSLPGFGPQKARIFLALLGKQRGVDLPGWREAAGPYGEPGATRSVADVVDTDTLALVRASKREAKQVARASATPPA